MCALEINPPTLHIAYVSMAELYARALRHYTAGAASHRAIFCGRLAYGRGAVRGPYRRRRALCRTNHTAAVGKKGGRSRVRRWRGVVQLACGAYSTVRFHPLLIEPDMRISLHPALGQTITPSPTARPDQAG